MVSTFLSMLEPDRVLSDLKALAALTSDEHGAQRVAWTEPWFRARRWLSEELSRLPVREEFDEAGNQWATLAGRSGESLIIGGHLDSVPNGGWLDGALNVLAGLEILRVCAARGGLLIAVRLVNWADEEGRFGHSLFGSSAAAGLLKPDAVAGLKDSRGAVLKDVLSSFGIDWARVGQSRRQLEGANAYLELHIEQGPVLWSSGRPLGVVTGTKGVHRSRVRFAGQAAHAGSTPMAARRDAFVAAARFVESARDLARAATDDVVSTVGVVRVEPGMATVVPSECEIVIDQRAIDQHALDLQLLNARNLSEKFAAEENVECSWTHIYGVPATLFHSKVVAACGQAVEEVCGEAFTMPSGPLHDATAMSRAGIPTGMIFVQSIGGHSHVSDEDSPEDHIRMGVKALGRATDIVLAELARP
jgi:hydantoinase/carbamoylase family amidase